MHIKTSHRKIALVLLCVLTMHLQTADAIIPAPKVPATWVPDASTGLMWEGQIPWQHTMASFITMNWQQANDYCNNLTLGSYSGWRLPTHDELNGMLVGGIYPAIHGTTIFALSLKGNIIDGNYDYLWTSSIFGTHDAWAIHVGIVLGKPGGVVTGWDGNRGVFDMSTLKSMTALCVRNMEPTLLQLAKDAQFMAPVQSTQDLKAYALVAKAGADYQAGQFQQAINLAQQAISLEPNFAPALYALALSQGRLGQWTQAEASIQACSKLSWSYGNSRYYSNATSILQWAKDGQKAEKKNKPLKDKVPAWNNPVLGWPY